MNRLKPRVSALILQGRAVDCNGTGSRARRTLRSYGSDGRYTRVDLDWSVVSGIRKRAMMRLLRLANPPP